MHECLERFLRTSNSIQRQWNGRQAIEINACNLSCWRETNGNGSRSYIPKRGGYISTQNEEPLAAQSGTQVRAIAKCLVSRSLCQTCGKTALYTGITGDCLQRTYIKSKRWCRWKVPRYFLDGKECREEIEDKQHKIDHCWKPRGSLRDRDLIFRRVLFQSFTKLLCDWSCLMGS